MRTLRIRKFMVAGMLSILFLPWWTYFVVHFIDTGTLQPWGQTQDQTQQAVVTQTLHTIVSNARQWQSFDFQHDLQQRLNQSHIDAVILSPSGQEIFASRRRHQNHWMPSSQVAVVEDGKDMGTVRLYAPGSFDPLEAMCSLCILLMTIFLVGFQMRRYVVKPLEAMSRSARNIAEGDLDLKLPSSRVTEIAEVRSGFEVMVAGLRESFQKQASLEEERRFFIGAIAHDLRTPLFALRGYLDGLEQGVAKTPEKISQYISVCRDKANQLDRLVSDLFSFTKLEYMEQTALQETMDLNETMERSVANVRPLAERKHVSIFVEKPASPCLLLGDPHLLERAVSNLMDNAVRYTPEDGSIVCKWFKEDNKVFVSIRDSGLGFSEKDLEHIFHPLYRGDESRNQDTGGAGLGLTIAKRIFKAHGGDLVAENHGDGGALLRGWIAGTAERLTEDFRKQ